MMYDYQYVICIYWYVKKYIYLFIVFYMHIYMYTLAARIFRHPKMQFANNSIKNIILWVYDMCHKENGDIPNKYPRDIRCINGLD